MSFENPYELHSNENQEKVCVECGKKVAPNPRNQIELCEECKKKYSPYE